jgi:hypothetical protein
MATLSVAFDGKVNIPLSLKGGLTIKELAALGVSRISIGPALQSLAMKAVEDEAGKLLKIVLLKLLKLPVTSIIYLFLLIQPLVLGSEKGKASRSSK